MANAPESKRNITINDDFVLKISINNIRTFSFYLEQMFLDTREKTASMFSNIFRGTVSVLHYRK